MESNEQAFFAHTSEDGDRTEPVKEHLLAVAEMASRFGAEFGCADWGNAAGILHDIGKYSSEFQRRLLHNGPKVDHSTAGALVAATKLNPWLAYCIAGHHAGLPDGGVANDRETTLNGRLYKARNGLIPMFDAFEREVAVPDAPQSPFSVDSSRLRDRQYCQGVQYSWSFFVRMVYSCLVDADYLCTERFMENRERACPPAIGLKDMLGMLEERLVSFYPPKSQINAIRCGVLDDCKRAAAVEPGVFSLTVPTGGGKTFALMRFALHHAVGSDRGFRRIICTEPYTSIIEQNAAVYRSVFGENAVLEHHSNYDFDKDARIDKDSDDSFSNPMRLAAENWDAPLIVTTNVQLFESLYANKPSRCRKLHNIARSVIVLDEAQMVPVNYLKPCVRALAELVTHYGCSVVLCTATQPALNDLFAEAGLPVREIATNPSLLVDGLRRVKYRSLGCLTDSELVEQMLSCDQALCIVNSRRQARLLYTVLKERCPYGAGSVFHLSTLMHPAHRSRTIDAIRERMHKGLPCLVVSTSLVEAGVDLDFRVVFRAIAGIDSMVQAAGRCNREMRHSAKESIVGLFDPVADYAVPSEVAQCAEVSRLVVPELRQATDEVRLDSLKIIRSYFSSLYECKDLDGKDIVQQLSDFGCSGGIPSIPFAMVASDFQMVENGSYPVIVQSEAIARDVELLLAGKPTRSAMRRLGRHSVNVYKNDRDALLRAGAIEPVAEGTFLLLDGTRYSEESGLDVCVEGGDAVFL